MDYKEKYEETLRKAKEYYANVPGSREFLDNIFPQLSESGDEKIRKEIIEYFHGCIRRNKKSGFRVEQIKGWIAYLEKQKDILGERAKNITANMLEDGIGGIQRELIEFLSNTVNASWVDIIRSADAYAERIRNIIEKQKEQKSRIDACGFPLRDKGESACSYLERCLAPDMRHVWYEACSEIREKQETQQPAEWSEDDENMLNSIIATCQLAAQDRDSGPARHLLGMQERWLKSLHPQPKAELTLLDKNIINAAVAFVEQNDHFNVWGGIDKHTVIKALRSLKPHWKPSEEQMCELNWARQLSPALESLYNDLKKLM